MMAMNVPDGFAFEVANEVSPSIHLSASPTWPDVHDDFTLRCEGHIFGRIRLAGDASSAEAVWEWQITVPMEMPEWARGSAGSREECVVAFAIALGRLLAETSPERLERAWDLERAAEARRNELSNEKLPAKSAAEVEQAQPETSPDRLERALELERAAEARQNKLSKEKLPARSAPEVEQAQPNEPNPPSQEDALAAIARALSKLTTDNLL
jgi:hypothetical protein